MTNQLARSNSPYLLQHQDNPVNWYPWGEQALDKARREEKPIFLSIGYAACHWCHVMAHESFEDPDTARIMNEHFVNIKVDREERPDLDAIYMKAVVAMTGQGGWPMSVFLTPEGKPFYGGTYFPPQPRGNLPSFSRVLTSIARAWEEDREELLSSSARITQHLQRSGESESGGGEIQEGYLEKVTERLYAGYDWAHGGWGGPPKFPQGMVLDFLLAQAARGNQDARDLAAHALSAMGKGGMLDLVGGGFSRYSVDQAWLVPHFEKMLYDNAILARAYLHGSLLTGSVHFRKICEKTLDFMIREMRDDQGGFYASLDADSEGEEGAYYVWTRDEIREALPDPADSGLLISAYGVSEGGNFEGKNVLQRVRTDQQLAEDLGLTPDEVRERLEELHQKLLEAREERVRPETDDKVLTAWNGLALTAFAEAGRYLERPDYTKAARENAAFLLQAMRREDGRLLRSWRRGKAGGKAYLEDYGALILGLLALYQTDSRSKWFRAARSLTEQMLDLFYDPEQGFFDTGRDQEDLIYKPQDIQDNATPSGTALAVTALAMMAGYEIQPDWTDLAEEIVSSRKNLIQRQPVGFGQWLQAADLLLGPLQEVAILGPESDPDREALIEILWESYRPRTLAAVSDLPLKEGSPRLLQDRELKNDRPTAYVCRESFCRPPVTTPEALREELEAR